MIRRWKAMENAQLLRIEFFFLIPYGLNTNSNTVKIGFERGFFKFVEMGQIIYRWIAIENAKLSHVGRFLYFATIQQ